MIRDFLLPLAGWSSVLALAGTWLALLSPEVFGRRVRLPAKIGCLTCSPCGSLVLLAAAVVALSWIFGDKVFVFLAAFLLIVITTAVNAVRWFGNTPDNRMQWSLRQLLLFVACIAVVLSTLAQQWPFRVRFALSRPALEALAVRIEQGRTTAKSEIAGLFFVRMTEIRGGYTCLWTDLAPSGYSGFIRRRTYQGPYSANLWCEARLNDEKWQFVIED